MRTENDFAASDALTHFAAQQPSLRFDLHPPTVVSFFSQTRTLSSPLFSTIIAHRFSVGHEIISPNAQFFFHSLLILSRFLQTRIQFMPENADMEKERPRSFVGQRNQRVNLHAMRDNATLFCLVALVTYMLLLRSFVFLCRWCLAFSSAILSLASICD